MRKFILLAATAFGLAAAPVSACDLDGMFGPHRFNAFAGMGGPSMFDAEPQPVALPQAPEPKQMDSGEPADAGTKPTTFVTLTDQLDKEPTEPPSSEKTGRNAQATPRENDGGPAPSATFR